MKQCDKKSLLTLCLGAAGMSLRLLQNMTGFEPGTGLPIPGSIPGILLPVLLALSAVILFRMNSKLPKGPVEVPLSRLLNWNDKEGLFGILAGGCVMAFSGVLEIANAFGRTVTAVSADGMEIVTVSAGTGRSGVVMGLLAVVAGICLLAGVAICRKTPDTEPQILLAVPVLLLAPGLTSFFNSKAEVVSYGALLLRLLSPFYFFFCINQVYSGALRGAGNSRMPMFIMLGSFVVFRQIYLYVMANYISNEIVPIALSYPAGWFVCSAATLLYYTHCKFDHYRLVEDV